MILNLDSIIALLYVTVEDTLRPYTELFILNLKIDCVNACLDRSYNGTVDKR